MAVHFNLQQFLNAWRHQWPMGLQFFPRRNVFQHLYNISGVFSACRRFIGPTTDFRASQSAFSAPSRHFSASIFAQRQNLLLGHPRVLRCIHATLLCPIYWKHVFQALAEGVETIGGNRGDNQHGLNCWFGLLVWVFFITLYFGKIDQPEKISQELNNTLHCRNIREMFRNFYSTDKQKQSVSESESLSVMWWLHSPSKTASTLAHVGAGNGICARPTVHTLGSQPRCMGWCHTKVWQQRWCATNSVWPVWTVTIRKSNCLKQVWHVIKWRPYVWPRLTSEYIYIYPVYIYIYKYKHMKKSCLTLAAMQVWQDSTGPSLKEWRKLSKCWKYSGKETPTSKWKGA